MNPSRSIRPCIMESMERPAVETSRRGLLAPLCRLAPLTRDEENRLFRELQSFKTRLSELQRRSRSSSNHSARIDDCRRRMERIRNRIVTANLRLLVSVARPFVTPELSLDDLVSAGILPLIRSVELFDPSRGFRFSTYATHSIRNHALRVRRRHALHRRRASGAAFEPFGKTVVDRGEPVETRMETEEDLAILQTAVGELAARDRLMLSARFGIGRFTQPRTFREMADLTGLSRERVRVLTHRALDRLRVAFERQTGQNGTEEPQHTAAAAI